MKPIEFEEQNIIIAEHQDEYISLPAYRNDSPEGEVVTCHKMTWKERLKVLFTGEVWLMQMTFRDALQPIRMEVDKWEMLDKKYFDNLKNTIPAERYSMRNDLSDDDQIAHLQKCIESFNLKYSLPKGQETTFSFNYMEGTITVTRKKTA